jgi:hypothetical protein
MDLENIKASLETPPKIGEIRLARDVGYIARSNRVIWAACEICGKQRWVNYQKGHATARYCRDCGSHLGKFRGEQNHRWKGGRRITKDGYVQILLQPGDFFYLMAGKSGYVFEHRLVMAKHLGRCLQDWELVHHKGIKFPQNSRENKGHNVIENLQLITDERHNQITILENKIKRLEKRNVFLTIKYSELKEKYDGIKKSTDDCGRSGK